MRDIKFRGKRKDGKGWAIGDLGRWRDQTQIYVNYHEAPTLADPGGCDIENAHDVDPETVGQYTGLKDRNGKGIYEGDILQFFAKKSNGFFIDGLVTLPPIQFGEFNVSNSVLYRFTGFHIDGASISYKLSHGCEVIGNIHENPELIKPLQIQ